VERSSVSSSLGVGRPAMGLHIQLESLHGTNARWKIKKGRRYGVAWCALRIRGVCL
jgi:hypothetical protein